jgi:hypothetical protein
MRVKRKLRAHKIVLANQTVTEEEIGPQKATEYLSLNRPGNRHLIKRNIDYLVREMEEHRFISLNGDTIRFTSDGLLADGQHRLHALILSNSTYRFLVVRGVSEEAFPTIDGGRKRQVADWLSMPGTPYYVPHYHVAVGSALRWVLLWETYHSFLSKETTTTTERLEALGKHPGLAALVIGYAGGKAGLRMSSAMLGACHYILGGQNKISAEEYMRSIVEGLELKTGDATYTVRQWIIKNRPNNSSNKFTQYAGHLILRGWNIWRRGEQIANFKVPEQRPELPLEK